MFPYSPLPYTGCTRMFLVLGYSHVYKNLLIHKDHRFLGLGS